ncbi:MAG: transglutaminase family protein [Rubellimicrobium sp.]|nr:transglutaminase family protein [Rubellimicrobium sp.]
MIYDIRVAIHYDYDRPALDGRHQLRLLPRDIAGVQRVHDAGLSVAPGPVERSGHSDFFGNTVTEVVLSGGHHEVDFEAWMTVERLAPAAGAVQETALAPLAALAGELSVCRDLGRDSPWHCLAPSPRIAADAAIARHAARAVAGCGTALAAVEALGAALHRDLAHDAEATTVETPPSEAFARGRGVCQDFAQVMIAGLRGLGIPAGYVSGFLRTVPPPGQARLEGADAMHAWVRAWCGAVRGWVEYDPTNGCRVATDHVAIAFGRDYGDVPPVAGILRGSGGQRSRQAVDVVPRRDGAAS